MNRFLAAFAVLALLCHALPAHAAELRVVVKDHRGKVVADAVVLATASDPKSALHAKPPQDAVDQVDKQFVPYVKPIFVGSKVRFPNSDNIRHQVYSFSPAKKFELPLYGGTDAPPVVFDKPGVVVLGCNIHDWMVGYIYVSETPFFAKTAAAGTASIDDMPPGDYTVRLWHPSMEHAEESTARRVTLNADAPTTVEWELALKPAFRVPRVSGAGAAGYP
jgi:plastocyanin